MGEEQIPSKSIKAKTKEIPTKMIETFNLFKEIKSLNKTPEEYGFTKTLKDVTEGCVMEANNLWIGAWTNYREFDARFSLPCKEKIFSAQKITVVYQLSGDGSSTISGETIITYMDNTKETKKTATSTKAGVNQYTDYTTEIELQNKQIKSIELRMYRNK